MHNFLPLQNPEALFTLGSAHATNTLESAMGMNFLYIPVNHARLALYALTRTPGRWAPSQIPKAQVFDTQHPKTHQWGMTQATQ